MKYCVINKDSNERVSRFFKTQDQAKKRKIHINHIVISKQDAIDKGIFVSSKRKSVLEYIPIEMVKGLTFTHHDNQDMANKANTDNYIAFCRQNGTLIPID